LATTAVTTKARSGPRGGTMRPVMPVHEREQLLRERDEAAAKVLDLTHSLRQMEAFVGVAAHELRGPATSGMLAIHLAVRGLHNLAAQVAARDDALAAQLAPLEGYLMRAVGSMERLQRLIGDLTDVSRIRAGTLPLRVASCDLAAVVSEAVEELRQIAPNRTIRLRVPARSVPLVLADADRIRQVVANYLANALRYAPADRPIDVRVLRRRDWVRVAVRDEGPGVPRAERRRIWERFRRGRGVSVAADAGPGIGPGAGLGTGLGLGLHICKTIVEQHHGRLGLRSALGRGATFWFALPLLRSDGGAPPRLGGGQLPPAAIGDTSDGVAA
jgi:signal transduction histidine kinase